MYVHTNAGLGAYRRRGMGAVTYDAQGMPIEDPANTTLGAQSGGTYPLGPVDSGNVCDSTSRMFDPNLCNTLYVPKTSLTSWLNTNSTMVAVGAAAFVGLLLFAKAGR